MQQRCIFIQLQWPKRSWGEVRLLKHTSFVICKQIFSVFNNSHCIMNWQRFSKATAITDQTLYLQPFIQDYQNTSERQALLLPEQRWGKQGTQFMWLDLECNINSIINWRNLGGVFWFLVYLAYLRGATVFTYWHYYIGLGLAECLT